MTTQNQAPPPSLIEDRPVGSVESVTSFHLVTAASRGKTLCGASVPDAMIGSYVEHLDTSGAEARWVCEVFGPSGRAVQGCAVCLSLYPRVLI